MNIAELRMLPALEKLKIIEALWEDLRSSAQEFKSPHWHEAELGKTKTSFAAGTEKALDWEIAKKELRARLE